jgi:hypothetical protein
MVLRGEVQFFSQDTKTPDTKNLTYQFDMVGTDGQILHFDGYKVINSGIAFSVSRTWRATTSLYVTVTRPDGSQVARGILHISKRNFLDEMQGFGPLGNGGVMKGLVSMKNFLSFFSLQTAAFYFSPFRLLQYPTTVKNTTISTAPKVQPTKIVTVTAVDGVQTTVHCWIPLLPNPELPPILFVPGAAVDHQIFALPTITTNAVEYFLGKGYSLYAVTHRVGRTEVAKKGYTMYDARLDIKAAMEYVRTDSQQPKMYCIAHCAGSVAFSMGLLDGTIPAGWLKGLTASQGKSNIRPRLISCAAARAGQMGFGRLVLWGNNASMPRCVSVCFAGAMTRTVTLDHANHSSILFRRRSCT